MPVRAEQKRPLSTRWWSSVLWCAGVLACVLQAGRSPLVAGQISLVDPGRVSSGVSISVTGTGFNATARLNEVVFTSATGESTRVAAAGVTTVNAARGIRRLVVRVPALPDGSASLRVLNTATQEESNTSPLPVLSLAVDAETLVPGETRVLVVTGSSEARFTDVGTRVALGAGITVGAVVVESPTRLRVEVSVAASAAPGPRTLEVLAPGLLASSSSIQVVPPAVNVAPVVSAGTDQTVTLPAGASLTGTATDDGKPSGGTLSMQWSQLSGAGTTTFAAPNSATTTATFSAAGTYVLRLTASDGALSTSDDVTVTVNAAQETNDAPTVNAGADQTVTLPAGASLTGTATDDGKPSGSTLSMQWSQLTGPGMTTFAAPTSATTTATFSAAGMYVLRLTASDGALSTSDDVAVTVNAAQETNDAPTVNAGADQTVTLPAGASLTGTATDDGKPSGSTLSVQWSQLTGPGTTTFAAPNTATTTATFSAAGTYVLRLTASDGALSTSDDVTVTVNAAQETNDAPTVNAGADQTVTLPAGASLAGTATDDGKPSGSTLSMQWSQLTGPGTTTFAAPTSATTTATFSTAGTYVLRLTASDGALSTSDDVTVTVNAQTTGGTESVNVAPTVNAGADLTVTQPALGALAGQVSDDGLPAGSSVGLLWTQVLGPADAEILSPTLAQTSVRFPLAGLYRFRLTASDGVLSDADDVIVTVRAATPPPNAPPTVTVAPELTVTLPAAFALAATATDDGRPVASTLVTTWEQRSGPGVLLIDDAAARQTVGRATVPGTYLVRFTADDGSLSASADVTVTVLPAATPANAAPTIAIAGPSAVTLPGVLALVATVTDDGLPAGAVVTTTWQQVSGPGQATFSTAGTTTQVAFPSAGAYRVAATATDGTLSRTAHIDITVSAATALNTTPRVTAGADASVVVGTPLPLEGRVEDDGLPAAGMPSQTWAKRHGPGAVTFAAPGSAVTTATFGMPGRYVLTLSATDGELVGADDVAVDVIPANSSDLLPPVLTLTAPARALPGQTVRVHAEVADDIGVVDVVFVVDGEPRPADAAAPYEITLTLPQVAAPGQRVTVRATARDASGRSSSDERSIEIASTPDTTSPTLDLRVPTGTAPGSTLTAIALATDDVGIDRVEFYVADALVETDDIGPFVFEWPVPAGASGSLSVRADAVDAAGNRTSVTRTVPVTAQADTTAPAITLAAPTQAAPGTLVPLTATVDDPSARVRFFVQGALLRDVSAAPYEAEVQVPDVASGTVLVVRAEARDLAGNVGTASREIAVVSRVVDTAGIVTGQVVDDASGLPLAGARVRLMPTAAGGTAREVVTSDAGRFEIEGATGPMHAAIDLDGYTSSLRAIEIVAQRVTAILDARLTRRAVPGSPAAGALRLAASGVQVDVLGAIATSGLSLTSISAQGLAAPLPAGWAPVVAFDLAPVPVTFAVPVVMRAEVPVLPPGRTMALVRWDVGTTGWRVVGTDLAVSGGVVEQSIGSTGQYALVLADAMPAVPAAPVAGAVLSGVPLSTLTDSDTGRVTPDPRVLFASPEARSMVTGAVTTALPASSGMRAQARLIEQYAFFDGASWQPLPRTQDVVLYQQAASASTLVGQFPAAPSRQFESTTLQRGVITVELRTPSTPGDVLVGAGGGIVAAPDDEFVQLGVPPGAIETPSRIGVQRVATADLGIELPAGVTAVDAFAITLPDVLAAPASLLLPRPAGAVDEARLLLARITEVGGRTHLVLVALVVGEGQGLRVTPTLGTQPTMLPGLRESGTYVLVQAPAALGLAAGRVVDGAGQSIVGALVTPGTFPVAAVSREAGAYVVAAPAGGLVLAGADSGGTRRGERPLVLTARVITPATLTLLPVPPQVTSSRPTTGDTNVLLDDPITLTFSRPLAAASLVDAVRVSGPGSAVVAVTTMLTRGDTVLEIRPVTPLAAATSYALTVAASVTDRAGIGLAQPFVLNFQTIDRIQPETPAAGTITASVPDRSGNVTVRGTQGTAKQGYQVFVENLTRRTTQVALVNADGSFAAGLPASVTDALRVRIVDASGNSTAVDIATLRQVNADGSVSQAVTAAGGVVAGPEGTRAVVKPGTFPDGATVTMKALPVSAFPRQLTPAEQQNFSFEKAISLDFDGATPQQYIDVSWPAAPTDKPTDQWVLTESVFVNGEWAMNVTDTVKWRDGRLTTASPPCPGVTAAAVYGLLKSSVPYGLNYAQMYADGRYKLKMSMEVFQGSPIAIPYAAFSTELPRSICFPAFVGRMSIAPNSTRITVSGTQLRPSDIALTVESTTRPTPLRFTRTVAPFHLKVSGYADDSFVVYAVGPGNPGGTRVRSTRYNQPRAFIDLQDVDRQLIDVVFDLAGVTPKGPIEPVTLVVDPADVGVPVTAFKVVAIRANQSVTVPVRDQLMTVNVPGGGAGETYTVKAVSPQLLGALDDARVVDFLAVAAAGDGNLVLRASPGTIDPTRAEMGTVSGPARTKFTLASNTPGFAPIEIPADRIVQGGLEFAFDGVEGATYTVITEYDTRAPFSLELPTVRYVLRNVNTNQVLKTIFGQAPPRDEPVELPPLTDDDVRPSLLGAPSRMDTFDPAGLLTFRFSESMDPASLRTAIVVRDGSLVVKGQVRISDQNRVATFVPDVPLELDKRYAVDVLGGDGGARDLAGNLFEKTTTFDVTTFIPRSLGVTTGGDPALVFKDTAWLFRDDGTRRRRYMAALLGTQVNNVRWFDATNPAQLAVLATASSAPSLQRIAAIDTDKLPALGSGKQMLLATTMFNVDRSALTFFRATEPERIGNTSGPAGLAEVGYLPLTINSSTFNPLNTTVRGIGYARNVVLHETDEGVRAIVAVEKYGVMSADVGSNISGLLKRTENAYPMNGVVDIAGYGDGVVAIATTPERNGLVAQLGPSLDLVGTANVPSAPRSIAIGRSVAIDIDRNGEVTPDERGDIAVVGTSDGVHVVRLSGAQGTARPVVLFSVPTAGVVKQVELDEERSRVLALVDEGAGSVLHIVDLARGDIDPPARGPDPRIIFRRLLPTGANGMRLDKQAGLLYIPTPAGLDTWLVADRCCDLGVELTADLDKKAKSVVSGNLGDVLKQELAAIKRGVVLGLRRAEDRCTGFDVSKLKLIESGSSGCLWADDPVRACGSNYQPLVSDHDISTFMPDDWYQREVNDPDWDGEGTPKKVLLAGCVVAALSFPFTDPYSEEPKPVGESGLVFKDISFIPNYVADFDSMQYRLERTIEGLPGDVDNDLAMGRQLLVMKHLTEAYGVDLRGTEGYRSAYAAVMVDEADFETRFDRFRNVTRIPEVEGYEWGVLMQFMLAKAKAYLRFKGASDERSSFNDFYVKQYHTAAKAGIRAAAARIVADTRARDLFLQVTREDEAKGLPVFRKNACLVFQRGQSPLSWPAKPCGSMEEYVAATAARSLRLTDAPFTEGQVLDIYKYYRVKADEQAIVSEAEADQFIADVHNFVMYVKRTAYPVYRDLIASDPRASERAANRSYAEGNAPDLTGSNPGGRIADFLKPWSDEERVGTKYLVKPKVYNRGFMSAPNVYLRAYVAPPGGAPALACVGEAVQGEDPDPALRDRCRLALNLNGGAQIFPAYRDKATGAYLPQPNSRAIDAFPLIVDQRAAGQVGHIVFTIDVPERSANEGDRTNNVGGVQFYILDPSTGTAPQMPADPPNPVNPQLLAPDPYCLRAPQLTVTQSVTLDQKERTSPVPAYLGAKFALNIHVTNTGAAPVENVLACSSLISDRRSGANAATCLNIGSIGPGATKVRTVDMTMPATPTNFESLATAKDQRLGVSSASLLRIGARCEPMLVELSPNPNALAQPVALGGRAVRHYMAIHPVTGDPAANVRVELSGPSGLTPYTYVSGADGLIDTVIFDRTIDGLAVPTRPNSEATWKLARVNDLTPECGSRFEFKAASLNRFRFTQAIEAGSAIKAGLSVFNLGPSGEASFGGGLRIEAEGLVESFPHNTGEPYASKGSDLANITWERKTAVGVSGGFRFPGFSAEGEFRGQYSGKAEGLKLDLAGSASATQAYRYFFAGNPTSWGDAQRSAFAALLFPSVSEAEAATFRGLDAIASDPIVRKVLEQVYGAEAPYRPYRAHRVGGFAINGKADAVGFNGSIDFIDKESQATNNPEGKENDSTPLFSANAAGNAELAIGYEKDEAVTLSGDDEVVRELVHTIEIDGKYNWKSSYATSFTRAAADIDRSNQAQVVKDKAKELLTWVETRLSNSATGDLDGGIRFRVFAKPDLDAARQRYRIYKLEVGFRTQKTYGFTTLGGAPLPDSGNDYRVNFVIEGEQQAEWIMNQAIGRGAVFVQLLSDAQKQRTTEFLNALGQGDVRDLLTEKPSVFSADQLYDQLVAFVRSLFLASTANNAPAKTTFYEESRRARATETDFGIGIAAKAKAIGFTIAPLRVEYASWYPSARGVILGGKGFLMEDYSGIAIAPPDGEKLFLDIAEEKLNQYYDGLGTEMRKGWVKSREAYEKHQKAKVTPSLAADLDKLDVASWEPSPRPDVSVSPTPYLGYAGSAPPGKPQYGIGDFYSLVATEPLTGPVTLEITYDEAELAGISEATLALYRWNDSQRDWTRVDTASVDTTANRVTAAVNQMGLYTLATRMPAGKLTWQVVSWSSTSSATTATLRATGLRMNDDSPVLPGTLVHVAVAGVAPGLVSFGTPDASSLPGHQAVADSDGQFTVTFTLPGLLAAVDVIGFSDVGTAVGEAKVARP